MNNIELRLFTVQGPSETAGIFTSNAASGYLIEKNMVRQHAIGISLQSEGTNRTAVRQNALINNNNAGPGNGTGIVSEQGLENARIGNNYFTQHENAAILLAGGPGTQGNIEIDENTIDDDSSIVLFNTTNTLVEQNTSVRPTGSGIFEGGGSTGLVIRKNQLTHGDSSGISLSDGSTSEVLIEENTLKFFVRGISLGSGNTNKTLK